MSAHYLNGAWPWCIHRIGLGDQSREDKFVWTDHSAADFLNWAQGQPDNHVLDDGDNMDGSTQAVDDEDVVEIRAGDGFWNGTCTAVDLY